MSWVWPPDTSSATKGNAGGRSERSGERRWPSRWWIPTAGIRSARPRAWAKEAPTSKAPASPGPGVLPTAGRMVNFSLAGARSLPVNRDEARMVAGGAELGTAPPVGLVHGHLGMDRVRGEAPGRGVVERDA